VKKKHLITGCIIIVSSLSYVVNAQVTDIEGNTYKTVNIGTQLWMAENLKTTKYNDGIEIPLVADSSWNSLTTHGYCWYNNNYKNYGKIYGALYNGYAAGSGKLCPTGWHVPTDAEWKTLSDYLGGDRLAGGKLKETGTAHWNRPNTGATNDSGFTALPGGGRWVIGRFDLFGRRAYWWSTSIYDDIFDASIWMIPHDENLFNKVPAIKGNGFSVRCIKD
jgi:uncharacterized protein (TIGR02145 family)